MRLSFALVALLASLNVGEAFICHSVARCGNKQSSSSHVFATVEAETETSAVEAPEVPVEANDVIVPSGDISAADIKAKLEAQLEKLRQKDSKSPKLSKEVSISLSSRWNMIVIRSLYEP